MSDGGEWDLLILGGGPGAFGPEVVAPFYDAILLGDGEEAFWEILAVYRTWREDPSPVQALVDSLGAAEANPIEIARRRAAARVEAEGG